MGRQSKDYDRTLAYLRAKYGEDFERLNGLADDQLDGATFYNEFRNNSVVADVSIDSSANVKQKDIVTVQKEAPKPMEKAFSYHEIFTNLKENFGLNIAKQWFELDWNKALYMHDANTSALKPYCFAYDLTRLANEGLFWLEGKEPMVIEPAQHYDTFVNFIKEFISFTSNRTSGACGLPNLIPYMYYFWKKDIQFSQDLFDDIEKRRDTITKEELLEKLDALKTSKEILMNPVRYAKAHIQELIYAMNEPFTRDGSQSAFVNTSIFDGEYFDALFGGSVFPNGEYMIDHKEGIMQFQKWFLEEMRGIKDRNKAMFTFPVNTISLLRKNGKFADEEFARWACEHNRRWNDSNFFVDDSVTSLSNCCRLKSNIKDLGYFNSIGGTALKVGSIKVSTINLARISLETNTEDEYLALLKERLIINLHALHVVRNIIRQNVECNWLTNFQDGLLDFEHLYNTVGINGIYETMVKFGYTYKDELGNVFYKDEAFNFGKRIFDLIHSVTQEYQMDKDYKINVEEIPGESASYKLMQADILMFGKKKVNTELPLYGNQWIPLGIKTTIQERVRICSEFDKYCDGGSICHLNVETDIPDPETAWELLNYVTDHGVKYFAFTGKISQCEDNHFFYGNVCPECGKPVVAQFARIVGFYSKTTSWSKERKAEFKLRQWEPVGSIKDCIENDTIEVPVVLPSAMPAPALSV